ncbi:MAG: ABC transporter ATP-binding protein [Candidatus Brocadiia bacterium]
MNLEGQYEKCVLNVTDDAIFSVCECGVEEKVALSSVEYVVCAEYVGNGRLEAHLKSGRQVPLIRYSKTLSDKYEKAEDEINKLLGREITQDEREKQHEQEGPSETKLTYRCPNCGYPLKHQGDVCPRCVDVKSMIWRLVKYLRPYWFETAVGLTLALILATSQLIPGLLLQRMIDGPLRLPSVPTVIEEKKVREGTPESQFLSEKVYRKAQKHQVPVEALHGTGTRGLITGSDLNDYLKKSDVFATPDAQVLAYRNKIHPEQISKRNANGKITTDIVQAYLNDIENLNITPLARTWAFHTGMDLSTVETPADTGLITKDEIVNAGKPGRLQMVLLLVGALLITFLVRSLIVWGRGNIMGSLGAKLMHDIRTHLYSALQRLSLSFYDREHTGRIMSRVTKDATVLRNFIVQGLQRIVIYSLTLVVLAITMIGFHWKLALLTLLPMPLMAIGTYLFARRARNLYRRIRRKGATLLKTVKETVSGVSIVKAFAQEERELDTFREKNRDHLDATVESVKLKSLFQPAVIFLTAVGTLIIYSYGGYLVIKGGPDGLTVGVLVMFNAFMAQFYTPVRQLSQLTDIFQQAAVSAERIFSIIDTPSEVADSESPYVPEKIEGHVVLDNVDFSYEKGERVLKDINLEVKPGEIIGLVGQTGSGKSTIVKLLARFYDPENGRIILDGHDLREMRLKSLRENIGMVLQETFLFTGTIRENIAYGRPEASNQEIIEAARAANAHDFIMDLPDAYDTYTGERGVGLSGGEKQRVAIARAILKDPAILILDEATSAVDTATEAMIQDALDNLMEGRTTFAIAHRLSTLQNANRLVVLENGEIAEMGTHDELLEKEDGIYRNLVEIQDLLSGSKSLQKESAA